MAGGRPTKYQPEYCDELIEYMSRGMTLKAFAGKISVNVDTVFEWLKVHPEFSDAYKVGQGKFEEMMLEMAHSVMLDKGSFNSTLWIFLMKVCCKYQDRVEVQGSINHQVINISHDVDED